MPEGTVSKKFLKGLFDVLKPGGVLSWKISIWAKEATKDHWKPIQNFAKEVGFQWACIDPVFYKIASPNEKHMWRMTSTGWPNRLLERYHSDAYIVGWKGVDEPLPEKYDPNALFKDDPMPYVVPSRTPSPSPSPDLTGLFITDFDAFINSGKGTIDSTNDADYEECARCGEVFEDSTLCPLKEHVCYNCWVEANYNY